MSNLSQKNKDLFENLFVLEVANNHLGKLDRGLKIVREHATVVRFNNIKAAIKLQFRDVDSFVHPEYKGNGHHRYINKTECTQLSKEHFNRLVEEVRYLGCIPMATPFDERSVEMCVEFDMPMVKIASSDVNDWVLIERIASTRKPTIASTGGASEKDLDDLVVFFERRNIPLAINHCVSLYPSEDSELELDQIDYLKARYPNHVIGLSTHEYNDWRASMLISYGKGVRSWERHVDIDHQGVKVSPYCSLPQQCDEWFKAFKKAAEMCGGRSNSKRIISKREVQYLDQLVRGVYAKEDIKEGYVFSKESFEREFFLAIPLHAGQLSCREVMNGATLTKALKANDMLTIHHIDGPYAESQELRQFFMSRGI